MTYLLIIGLTWCLFLIIRPLSSLPHICIRYLVKYTETLYNQDMEFSHIIADAQRLTDSSDTLPSPEARPVIILVSGLPGTGKSYFCRRLAERLPFIILESDALRKKMFPRPSYTAAESVSLFRVIHYLIEELLQKGVSLILDATNLVERHRKTIYNIAERAHARVILIRVAAPPELVQKRLQSRKKQPGTSDYSDADWAVYQKMKATAERISRRHYTVNTSGDITPVIDRIVMEASRKETGDGN